MPSSTDRSRGVSSPSGNALRLVVAPAGSARKSRTSAYKPRPGRLVGEQHVVFAVELNESAIGNEAREQTGPLQPARPRRARDGRSGRGT